MGIQPLGQSGQRPELSQATGMSLVRCILNKFLGVVCHCFPQRLEVPTFTTRCPASATTREIPAAEGGTCGRELSGNFCLNVDFHVTFRDLLHAANLPPKGGVLRIFSPLKIRRPRPGLNPRTWVPKASTLPLDHRSRIFDLSLLKMCVNYFCVQKRPAITTHTGFT